MTTQFINFEKGELIYTLINVHVYYDQIESLKPAES